MVAVAGEEAPSEAVEEDEDDALGPRRQAVERDPTRPRPRRRRTVSGSAANPPPS
jgi:hypothetical protein